jgi:osmotically-inducible protein OsmY
MRDHMYEAYGEPALHRPLADTDDVDIQVYGPSSGFRMSPTDERIGMPRGPFAGYGPSSYRRADERIHEDVCERLRADPMLDASDIEVRVEGGIVWLEGTVGGRDLRWHADELAASVWGVRDVRNRLRTRRALS